MKTKLLSLALIVRSLRQRWRLIRRALPSDAPAQSNCFSCHTARRRKATGADLARGAAEGWNNGAALDLNSPEKSALIEALAPDRRSAHAAEEAALRAANRRAETLGAGWRRVGCDRACEPVFRTRKVALTALPASYHPVLALALSPDSTRLAVGCGKKWCSMMSPARIFPSSRGRVRMLIRCRRWRGVPMESTRHRRFSPHRDFGTSKR